MFALVITFHERRYNDQNRRATHLKNSHSIVAQVSVAIDFDTTRSGFCILGARGDHPTFDTDVTVGRDQKILLRTVRH